MPLSNPSPHQLTIRTFLHEGVGSLCVEAVAGSGKTTTLIWLLETLPRGTSLLAPSICFLAFNKAIAETLSLRCPRGTNCSTFHSLGFRALKQINPKMQVEGRKVAKLLYRHLDKNDPDFQKAQRLVSLLKSVPPTDSLSDDHLLKQFIIAHDMDIVEEEKVCAVVSKVFHQSVQDLDTIDFDDMLYLPVLLNAPFDQMDWVFVDESQDTNDIQVKILSRLGKKDTRFVFVGDPHQAIYGFRGANSDAMDKIRTLFSCSTLPLSICYRCSQEVVKEAQKVLNSNK